MTPLAALQCLRLASPGLPIGGYSYSQGLETAIDLGQIHDRASAEHWLVADHTKLNRCEPWRVAGLSDIHHLFLDRPWAELGDDPALSVHIADA